MKKIIAFLGCIALIFSVSLSAFAAGVDDGKLFIAKIGETRYLGEEITSGLVKYVAANGNGAEFYDASADKYMDICDLVAVATNSIDFNLNGNYDDKDDEALRVILINVNI